MRTIHQRERTQDALGAVGRQIAVVVEGAEVVEDLEGAHHRLGRRRVHKVKVHLGRGGGGERSTRRGTTLVPSRRF